jgi:hypothetical protein
VEEAAPAPVAKPAAGAKPAAAASKTPKTKAPELPTAGGDDSGSGSGSGGEDGESGGPESRGHMLQRHKRVRAGWVGTALARDSRRLARGALAGESTTVTCQGCRGPHTQTPTALRSRPCKRAQEMLAHKKAMQRSGKKSKDEIAKLTANLEKRHAAELRGLDEGGSSGSATAAASGSSTAKGGAAGTGDTAVGGSTAKGGAPAVAASVGDGDGDPLSKYMKGLTMDSAQAAAQSKVGSLGVSRRRVLGAGALLEAAMSLAAGPSPTTKGLTLAWLPGNVALGAWQPSPTSRTRLISTPPQRPSKAQKRREKHAARDAEREARIAAEKEALGTPERLAEEAELKALLAPLGLGIKEIRVGCRGWAWVGAVVSGRVASRRTTELAAGCVSEGCTQGRPLRRGRRQAPKRAFQRGACSASPRQPTCPIPSSPRPTPQADGHCMYRSVEHQLRVTKAGGGVGGVGSGSGSGDEEAGGEGEGEGEGVPNYQELREMAADYIRAHREEFAPYLVPEDEASDPAEHFEAYCNTIEETATWGGHLELQALAGALARRITVYGVGMAPQVLGEGFEAEGAGLKLCFLRHALGLGEHYNSTKRLLFAPGGEGTGRGDEGDEGDEE